MKTLTKTLGMTAAVALLSIPVMAGTTSNLKSSSGKAVGGLDAKHYNNQEVQGQLYIDNPFYDDKELRNDIDIDIDNPFVDDPELHNDVNWDWPEFVRPNQPVFPQIDSNKDGYLSQKEFMNGTLLENESAVFAMLDKNQSGYISKTEFNTYSKTGGKK